MRDDSQSHQPLSWVIHADVSVERSEVEEKRFRTPEEAEAYLADHDNNYWRGPIPVRALTNSPCSFDGPWLADSPAFADLVDREVRFKEVCDKVFADSGVDMIPVVTAEMEREGKLPPTDYSRDQQREVLRRVRGYALPKIECSLGEDWFFPEIEADAKRLPRHVEPDRSKPYVAALFGCALALEEALRYRHEDLSAADIFNFWSSLEVWLHLARFCGSELASNVLDKPAIETARQRFGRMLGSYAHSVRLVEPMPADAVRVDPHPAFEIPFTDAGILGVEESARAQLVEELVSYFQPIKGLNFNLVGVGDGRTSVRDLLTRKFADYLGPVLQRIGGERLAAVNAKENVEDQAQQLEQSDIPKILHMARGNYDAIIQQVFDVLGIGYVGAVKLGAVNKPVEWDKVERKLMIEIGRWKGEAYKGIASVRPSDGASGADEGALDGGRTERSYQAQDQPQDRGQVRACFVAPILRSKGMSRCKWASKAGVDPSVVYDYLKGISNPRPENRNALAEAIGVQESDLPE